MRPTALAFLALVAAGCGPLVSETRMSVAPPRPGDCGLQFVKTTVADLAPIGGKYEVLGYVTLSETGIQDPFAERYRAIVRPRACAMGGESVSMMMSSSNAGMMGRGGSGTVYAILREAKPRDGAPTSF